MSQLRSIECAIDLRTAALLELAEMFTYAISFIAIQLRLAMKYTSELSGCGEYRVGQSLENHRLLDIINFFPIACIGETERGVYMCEGLLSLY